MSYTTNRYIQRTKKKKKIPLKKNLRERERINTNERKTNVTYLVVNETSKSFMSSAR